MPEKEGKTNLFREPPPQVAVQGVHGPQSRKEGQAFRLHSSVSVPSPKQLNPKLHVLDLLLIPVAHDLVQAPHDSL